MEEQKKVNSGDGEIPLPLPVIHCIQSSLSGKQAARTTLISKSWYNSWLTRPTIDFDARSFERFRSGTFWEFVAKTVQRYLDLKLNINSFNLHFRDSDLISEVNELINKLLKLCVHGSDCKIEFKNPYYVLLSEVLESPRIAKLSVFGCKIHRPVDGNLEFSRLKSLNLERTCIDDGLFFNTFSCLEELSLIHCECREDMEISSTSLRLITIVVFRAFNGKFNIPNIRKYTYSGLSLPSLNFTEPSSKWEFKLSIKQLGYRINKWWFNFLKGFLKISNLLKCEVSLSVEFCACICDIRYGGRGLYLSLPEPPMVENFTVSMQSDFLEHDEFLTAIFRSCRAKIMTLYWFPKLSIEGKGSNKLIKSLSLRVIPERNLYCDLCGLSNVDVEIFEETVGKWQPLDWKALTDGSNDLENKRKVRFLLGWL